ncbi:hypothetical protein BDR26DRAFT_901935 [Obelidium mucronatum]|nr:hypothetical protein BDR26DRAFT_901935 [Obelidium mucronatum]
MTATASRVAIFWDYENCQVPKLAQGYDVVGRIRKVVGPQFGPITCFRAYLDITRYSPQAILQLSRSNVDVLHCPHDKEKDIADFKLLVDMLSFAIDFPPTCNDCFD